MELFEFEVRDKIEHFAAVKQIKEGMAKHVFDDDVDDNKQRSNLLESLYALFKTICYLELLLTDSASACGNRAHNQNDRSSYSTTSAVTNVTAIEKLTEYQYQRRNSMGGANEAVQNEADGPAMTPTPSTCPSSSQAKRCFARDTAYDHIIEVLGIEQQILTQADIEQSQLTELHLAVARKHVDEVRRLIEYDDAGLLLNARASEKFLCISPLLLAVAVESYWCIMHFFEAKVYVDISVTDSNGHGFLDYLKRTSWTDILTPEHLRTLKKLINELVPMLSISGKMDDLKMENCLDSRSNGRIGRIIQGITSSIILYSITQKRKLNLCLSLDFTSLS